MPTDVHTKTRRYPQTPRRWLKRMLPAIGVVAVVVSAAALISAAGSSRQSGPKLTYTVTRGDLIVTVTEQGTLESAEKTEIKCKVRDKDVPIIWVVESGTKVEPGDELVRLGTLVYEDRVSEMTKYYHLTKSAAERSKADVAIAELAIPEYLEGTYRSQLMTLEKDLAIAQSNLRTAINMLDHANMMAERDYVSALVVEEKTFALRRAELNLEVKNAEIKVLKEHTREMELETLNGNLKAAKSKLEADMGQAKSLADRLGLALADLEHCVIKAERGGVVTYPSAKPWEYAPEIEEGAMVYMGQTLLLMPDLSKMQVKVGIDESIIDRIKPGLAARITLPNKTLEGEVSSVASVTKPAGWWTGNVVAYDTIIELPSMESPKPGMSAEVEVIIDRHENVLMIPVAAVVETAEGDFCWVKTPEGAKRRSLGLGDTNDVFTVVKTGLKEGDEILLHPFAFEEIQIEDLKPRDETKPRKSKPPSDSKKQKSKSQAAKPKQADS